MQPILTLDPERELRFKGSYAVAVPVELKMTNSSKSRICYKVKTTAPKQYTVRPSNGVVEPGDQSIITITLHPFEFDPAMKYSHKFMVQSLVVPEGSSTEIEDLWSNATAEQRMDSKLRCILDYMPDENQVAPVKVDESAADRQRLLAENAKLKVMIRNRKIEAEKMLDWLLPEMARKDRFMLTHSQPDVENDVHVWTQQDEGSRLRQMVMMEQDRAMALRENMSRRGYVNFGNVISLFMLIIGVAIGCYVGKFYI